MATARCSTLGVYALVWNCLPGVPGDQQGSHPWTVSFTAQVKAAASWSAGTASRCVAVGEEDFFERGGAAVGAQDERAAGPPPCLWTGVYIE